LAKGSRAEGIDHHLHVDLAHALERAPVEGVLIEQLARGAGLDVPAAEVWAVALQQAHLLLGEHEGGGLAGFTFQPHQAFVTGLQVVAQPDAAHPGRRDLHALQPQLVAHALGAVGGPVQAVVQHLGLDLGGQAVWVRAAGAAAVLHQGGHAAHLEGTAHLVEGVAVVAHHLAGAGDVAEFVGQLQQGQFALGTLR
jgi:hypothetical protein